MKKYIVTGILCLSSFCYSQSVDDIALKAAKAEADGWPEYTCKKGVKDAESDSKKGIYNSYSFGFRAERIGPEGRGFDIFYEEYVLKTYSINIKRKGCVATEYWECYADAMKKNIFEKFGSDIFTKAREEALKLFSKKE